jgi:hypothetical protein
MHLINPQINTRICQIIKGTILGGSSLIYSKNSNCPYLSMRSKNYSWLYYKASELSILSSNKCIIEDKTNRWHSMCYPIFKEIHNIFYSNKLKLLKNNALDDLHDIAYMIWFGDSGSLKNNILNLNIMNWKQSSDIICKYFKESGFNFTLNKNYKLTFDEKSSLKIMNIISPHFPSFFKLKKI